MGRHCAAFGCYNSDTKINKKEHRSISFHCFPIKYPEILNQWYAKIKRVDFKATIHSRICSEHFNEEDFQYQPFTNCRQLKRNAIPSKFYYNNIRRIKRGRKKIGTSDVFSASAIDVYEKEKEFVSKQAPEHNNIQDISEFNFTNQLEKQLVKLEKEEATDSDEFTSNFNVEAEQCVPKNTFKMPVSSHIDQSKDKTFKKYECQICQKVFSSSSSSSRHKVTHTKEKPFHCQKVFSRSSNVKTQQRIHLAEKTYKCEICQKDFSCSPNVMQHQMVYSNERTFKRPICQKGFSTSSYLTRHQMLHASELPFRCDTCLGAFPYPTELEKHSLVPNSDEGFNGNVCLQVFSSSSKLNQHKICRTEKKSCDQDLCFPSGFKKHLVAYSRKKTIKCPVCQPVYSNCANLKNHLKTDKKKIFFKCAVCQKTFVSSSSLERHQRFHPVHMPLYVSPALFQRHGHQHSSPMFERHFQCCLCNVVFVWKRKLEQHIHAHIQGNIWVCLLCNMNFTDIHLIEKHILTHIQGMSA